MERDLFIPEEGAIMEDLDRQLFLAGRQAINAPGYSGALTLDDWNAFWESFTPDMAGELAEAVDVVEAQFRDVDGWPQSTGILALAVVAHILRARDEVRKAVAKRSEHADYEATPERREKRREQARNGAQHIRTLHSDDLMASLFAVHDRAADVADWVMDDVAKYATPVVSLTTAAAILDRHPETLRSWRKGGIGPACVRIGGQWAYPLASLAEWITGKLDEQERSED
jgi:hypothetical protein